MLGIILAALLCTFSSLVMSWRRNGPHTQLAYSRWGLTNVLWKGRNMSSSMYANVLRIRPTILFLLLATTPTCLLNFRDGLNGTPRSFSSLSYFDICPSCSQAWKKWQNRKLLARKFCDLEGKNKEIHKGNHPTLEGNLPCWREILPSLQGNKHFSRPGCSIPHTVWTGFILSAIMHNSAFTHIELELPFLCPVT